VIHYHGGPITPTDAALTLWQGRHACVSFEHPQQTARAFEVCQSVMLDNGAFSKWKKGGEVDIFGYADWVAQYERHPSFDWCLIPDAIDGDEADNERLIAEWFNTRVARDLSVPVWHMHESLERLTRLVHSYPRIALGSSGSFATIGTPGWWERMAQAMAVCCDAEGRPVTRLHGLRMLSPTVFSHIPLASADSTNVARNIGIDKSWKGPYRPVSNATRALVLAERIESHVAAARFNAEAWGTQHNLELIG
jgi:hypothetical protein